MTEIIPVGVGAFPSDDIPLAANTSILLHVKDAAGPTLDDATAVLRVQIKTGTDYFTMDTMGVKNPGVKVGPFDAATVWRVYREPSSAAAGAEKV